MKNILYISVLLFFVCIHAQDNKPIDLEAFSGNSSILLRWDIPEKINVKEIRLFRTQNSFSDYTLIYKTSSSIERFLDDNVKGKRPYFYNIEIESYNGNIFSSIVDAPPFGKAYIDQNLFPVLSKEENNIVNNKYTNIEEFHDHILEYIISDIIVSADSIQLNTIQHMIQYRDEPFTSWMRYVGFESLSTFEDLLADESLNDIRQQLENTLNKLRLFFNNQFLLTPTEWNGRSNLFSDYVFNRLISIREMLVNEINILSVSSPVLPLGTWRNADGKNIARLAIIHPDHIQSIVLLDENYELIVDESNYQHSQVFDIELIDNMKKYELIINGNVQKILPVNAFGYGLSIDDQFFMLEDTTLGPPVKISQPMRQFCLNEIVNMPETNQIFIELHGNDHNSNTIGLFINDLLVWEMDHYYSFDPIYADSVFMLEYDISFLWIDLKIKDDYGLWQTIDTRAVFTKYEITEGRIPDHHGWKQYSISTLGEPNDLVNSAISQLMIPEIFAFYQNYPNPFNSETTISFDLLQTATISLYVNDAAGRIIHLFFEENKMNKGLYNYTWNGENFSSGLYFMTIQAQIDDYLPIIFSRKMIYLK
ncbi:MAG: T9SS type A sorting domain-containing protein [Candidatus Marinimicrobia bacterium]|nr:T9SS type A sorting domain-containing protein [Candidatus Neomarinimicrobiota bacterium]